MKNFKMRRFGALLRLDLAQNKKSYLNFALVLFVLYFLLELMLYAATLSRAQVSPEKTYFMQQDMADLFFPISIFVMIMGASWVFSVLKNKKNRISYLMLPASNLEKYLCRLLICTVGIFLVNGLVFALTDVVRSLLFIILDKPACLTLPTLYETHVTYISDAFGILAGKPKRFVWSDILNLIAMVSSMWSIFVLGSSFFRKHSFVYTAIFLLALSILVNVLVQGNLRFVVIGYGFWKGCLFTLVMLALSYWQFKRSTVMRRTLF